MEVIAHCLWQVLRRVSAIPLKHFKRVQVKIDSVVVWQW